MESEQQSSISSDLLGTVVRPPSIRVSGSFKSNLSGRLTPRNSPSFRRSPSVQTPPARDFRYSAPAPLPWYWRPLLSRRLLPWLVVIGLWAYIGLLMQSRWAHNDGQATLRSQLQADQDAASRVFLEDQERVEHDEFLYRNVSDVDPLTRTDKGQHLEDSGSQSAGEKTQGLKPTHSTIIQHSSKLDASTHKNELNPNSTSWIFPSIVTLNASVGTLVGPFQDLEKSILGSIWSEKLSSCPRERAFAEYVRGRSFMLVFHELSMTGSPLAMLELAKEILSCGGKVIVVALSQKGGLLQELLARKIKVLKSKASSFKAAGSVDLIVAGSAVCASWIENYQQQNKKVHRKLVWWIMENRREYFDRSKHILGFAKALIFLSEAQLKQWTRWSQSEGISLPHKVVIVPLCVNEELSLAAGLYDRNTHTESTMQTLRHLVRAHMGLKPHDVLFTTLSSINPGKGQLKLLQAAAMVVEDCEGSWKGDSHIAAKGARVFTDEGHTTEASRFKLLVGSVGSKSNKVDYIQKLLEYIGDHPRLAEAILWTPVSVHVASLYAASDAYVMNSQGIGETFGRVTVEAMAFSLPILGTSAGGTSEIVENNKSGLLHPIGADGVPILAQHISLLLKNVTLRESMGLGGKNKVKQSYLKETMYENLAAIFSAL